MANQSSLAATCLMLVVTLSAIGVAVPSAAVPASGSEKETHAAAALGDGEGTPLTVAMVRGEHITFAFWPNWRKDGRTFAGRIVRFDGSGAALPGTEITLVRYERIGTEPADPMGISLRTLQEGAGRIFLVEELLTVEADKDGYFEFPDLGGGMYSVQPAWSQIESGVEKVMLTSKVPEVVSLGEPRVVSLSAGYPGDRSP